VYAWGLSASSDVRVFLAAPLCNRYVPRREDLLLPCWSEAGLELQSLGLWASEVPEQSIPHPLIYGSDGETGLQSPCGAGVRKTGAVTVRGRPDRDGTHCTWQITPEKPHFAPSPGQSVTFIGLRADAILVLTPLKPMRLGGESRHFASANGVSGCA
jgi:hypothetical protein